ncbi:MAG: hypothetical protein AB7V42_01885 [Thermoleophilia bacterium]
MRTIIPLAVSAVLALATGPACLAATVEGTVADPTGDATGGGPDIVSAQASYDDSGAIRAVVTLAAPPAAGSVVIVQLGPGPSGAGCATPNLYVGTLDATGGAAEAGYIPSPGETGPTAPATMTLSGATVAFDAPTSPVLAGRTVACGTVAVAPSAAASRSDITPQFTLTAPPPPPEPAPPAPPAAPALAVTVSGVPSAVRRGRWITARVRVANTGTAPAKKVRVTVGSARGVVRRGATARTVASIAPGKAVTLRLRLRLAPAARASSVLAVRARSGTLTAAGRIRLSVRRPAPPAPRTPAGPLTNTYWWGFVSHTDWAWDNRGVYFYDGRWAYRGIPTGGLPACTRVTAGRDEKGNPTDGCVRYTYDARTGALTVGDLKGTYKGGKLTLDDVAMTRLGIPPAGARYQTDLEHRGFRGLCGLILGCTTWHYTLALNLSGEFVYAESSLSSLGDGFTTPGVWAGRYPPNQTGTYRILPRGTLRLSFADGTVTDRTIGIDADKAGRRDPVTGGLLLDDTNFYPADD